MNNVFKILTINPGSTSTKIAVFDNEDLVFEKTLRHSSEEIGQYEKISDQFEFRKTVIEEALAEGGVKTSDLDAVVGRGGLLKPIQGGTYVFNEVMKNAKNNEVKIQLKNLTDEINEEFSSIGLSEYYVLN